MATREQPNEPPEHDLQASKLFAGHDLEKKNYLQANSSGSDRPNSIVQLFQPD
jgi:hypothetical protein